MDNSVHVPAATALPAPVRVGAALALVAALSAAPVETALATTSEDDPTGRVVAVIDRADIAMSGLASVRDLIFSRAAYNSFGLFRPSFGTGTVEILVNGRTLPGQQLEMPSISTAERIDALPVSAVERIEILDQGGVRHDGHTVSGAVNIVLRHGYEGAWVSAAIARPTPAGGDSHHGSAGWGGALGEDGHLLVGVDHIEQQEVRDADRAYTRSRWTPGGSIHDAFYTSTIGNTIDIEGLGLRSLGDCDESVYTGVLTWPDRGEVCGYAYSGPKWHDRYQRRSRESVFLNANHPLSDDADLYAELRAAQGDSLFRYAPPATFFEFVADNERVRESLIRNVEDLTHDNFPADGRFLVRHRFVGHGPRDWREDMEERHFTLGARGGPDGGLGYDVYVRHYRHKIRETGETFVSISAIREAIENGEYDIANPLSPADPARHQAALERSSVRLDHHDTVRDYTSAVAALRGRAFAMPGGDVQWTAGIEVEGEEWRDVYDYRDSENRSVAVADVSGAGGSASQGERLRVSARADTSLPVLAGWDLGFGARHDHYDDVGGAFSWRAATRYLLLDDALAFRASWDRAEEPPSLRDMHIEAGHGFSYICDPRHENLCADLAVVRNGGNPDLGPEGVERLSLGIEARAGVFSLAADWFSVRVSNQPETVSPQTVVDRDHAGNPVPGTRVTRRNDRIASITTPLVEALSTEREGVAVHVGAARQTRFADFAFDLYAVHTSHYERRVLGEKEDVYYPRNRGHAVLRAKRGDASASWNVHAVSGYWSEYGGRYEGWVGHNLAFHLEDSLGIDGLDLTGGVLNVEDRDPPTDGLYDPDSTLDSLRGRTFFLNAAMSW